MRGKREGFLTIEVACGVEGSRETSRSRFLDILSSIIQHSVAARTKNEQEDSERKVKGRVLEDERMGTHRYCRLSLHREEWRV